MTAPSLLDELEGVVRLAEKATPGEWVCYPGGKRATVHSPRGHVAFFSQRIFGARGEGPVTADEMVSNARLTAGLVNLFRAHHAEIAAMAKRLEAAERDSKRLDWLESVGFATRNVSRVERPANVHCWTQDDGKWMWTAHFVGSEFTSARAAIDAATQEGEG